MTSKYEIRTDGERFWVEYHTFLQGFWPWSRPYPWGYSLRGNNSFVGIGLDEPKYFLSQQEAEQALNRYLAMQKPKTVKIIPES